MCFIKHSHSCLITMFLFTPGLETKGEEYRVTGYGGWSWISKTHVYRFVPKLPGNTNVHYRKSVEGGK